MKTTFFYNMTRSLRGAICIALAVASLASCSLYKKYERPQDIKTDNLYGTALAENSEETMAQLSWRDLYSDPQLQALIEQALANNAGLKAQQWAVAQAQASKTASKMAFLPSLTFAPSGGYSYPADLAGKHWSYQLPVALNWELDIFGGLHNQKKMAGAALEMQKDLQQAVHARLIATVAGNYYQLLALDQTKSLLQDAMVVWDDLIRSAEAMMENGYSNAIAVSQFKGQRYDFQTSLNTVEHNITQLEIAICSILGEAPHAIGRGSIITCPSSELLRTGLSSQLLANRPDVRQAERNLEYYFHNVKYARSNFFPKFTIDGQALYNGNWVASIIGGLTQPIFARGKIIAENKIAKAQYEAAKLDFQQKLIDASGEVVLAISQCESAHKNFETRKLQVEEYRKAVEYSRTLMVNGECTYLDVLTAQSNLFDKQKSLIDDRLEEMLGTVNLYLALGGGSN